MIRLGESLSVDEDELAYRSYALELTRFATGLIGPADAADVVSEAVLRCFASPAWSEVADRRSYLYRAVLNEARQTVRSRRRREAREASAGRRASVVSTVPELRFEVLAAVRRLSVRQRAVIVLTYWQDLTPLQVAERLGLSEGSVRRHLARARAQLRKVLPDE